MHLKFWNCVINRKSLVLDVTIIALHGIISIQTLKLHGI